MVTDQLSAPLLADPPVEDGHPMDSSRILLSMMDLARQGEQVTREDPESLDSVVARPVLRQLLAALHDRDAATMVHSRRVALLAVGMAQQLGWESRHLRVLEVAALLHDFGKIGVPDNILMKPGKLSSDEADLISVNHNIGVDILQACRLDKEVVQIVTDSQAYYDAPDETRPLGEDMHLGARILAVADAYDSLSNDQVFREGKPHEQVMEVLRGDAGTKFDGNVVDALARWVDDEGLPFLMDESHSSSVGHSGGYSEEQALSGTGALCHIFSHLYVLESLYDGFYLLDSEMRFVVWNRGVGNLLARNTLQMLGQPWSSRLIPFANPSGKRLSDRECQVHQVMSTGRPACRTLKVQQRDGSWIDVELQSLPLKGPRGDVLGVAEIFRDVTRSKRNAPQFRKLKLAASRDPLTDVANRGEMEKQLSHLFNTAEQKAEEPFSVIFLDIDHFKKINDTHGHSVGDRVLIDVARLMQSELYSGELVARYGGEEFVVLCPATDMDSAYRKAERLRTTLSETSVGETVQLKVTASLGVSQVEPEDTMESLLTRADTALYNAKQRGRNRTCSLSGKEVAPDPESSDAQPQRRGNVFYGSFTTCMMPEMAVYKVGGFVSETDAKVKKVQEKQVDLQVGRGGLLGGWGSQQERQPVHLTLEIGDPEDYAANSASKRAQINVTIKPIGRPQNAETFQRRSKHVLELLRCHFAAD